MSDMAVFQDLGDFVRTRWSRANFDHRALPEIAAESLARTDFDGIGAVDILRWVQTTDALPYQGNIDSLFGQPPLTVFWDVRFYIEVLFWDTATTSIHQHGFSGAFTLLQGQSVESRYHFEERHRVNDRVLLGDIVSTHVGLLRVGDVRHIHGGRTLIHSVFHLDVPSVTVVVRSHEDPGVEVQYEYFPPYLAVDPFYREPLSVRRLQCLKLLGRLRGRKSEYEDAAATVLQNAAPLEAVRVLEHAVDTIGDDDLIARLFGVARVHRGAWVDQVETSLRRLARTNIVRSRRRLIDDEDHRFLLALLATTDERDTILSMVADRAPGRDAMETIVDWAKRMSGTDIVGIEFDELNVRIFRLLLAGVPAGDVPGRLAAIYDADDIEAQHDDLHEHIAAMCRSEVFGPLLSRSAGIRMSQGFAVHGARPHAGDA